MAKSKKKDSERELNENQKLFCSYYVIKWNKTRSYLAAYDPINNIDYLEELGVDIGYINNIKVQKSKKRTMTDATAAVNAVKLLRNAKISKYIELIRDDPAKSVGISKEWSLGLLKGIAEKSSSDITKLYKDWIELDDFEEMKKKHPKIMASIQAIDYKTEQRKEMIGHGEFEEIEVKYVKIKLMDSRVSVAAIAEINKMMGWNASEKIEVSGTLDHGIKVSDLKPESRKDFMNNMKAEER